MIEKFTKEEIESVWMEPVAGNIQSIYGKVNELVDAVNKLETMAKNTNTVLKSLVEENNIHEKQIDALQMDLKQLKGAFIVRLDENDEPATATPMSSVLEIDNE